ncbi:hypothetical protein FKW77_000465 [Venturia effusa]|uniref:Uncharacterized protein n=1 Tax=Venturia effusa TaxID=50376 RepID=A0A517LQK9_9PEZI|nr:hypothetical protein FKW77_000465 [Venturia effusa]
MAQTCLPLPGRQKERSKISEPKTVSFSEGNNSIVDRFKPEAKRRNSIFSSIIKGSKEPASNRSDAPKKSRYEIATEILDEEKAANLFQTLQQEKERLFWRKRNEDARQRYYGVTGGQPRYGWESPHAKETKTENSSKLEKSKGLGRSKSLGAKTSQQAANSPTPSTREMWNTLYSKNQEIQSLRLSHQEMLEELHAYQIGLQSHKRALDEARWESEECYQALSLLNRLAGEGKHFDKKVWVERIQLRTRLRILEVEKEELTLKWEQSRQMLENVDAMWHKELEEKEWLKRELANAKGENKRLSGELERMYAEAGHNGLESHLQRRDSLRDEDSYDAPEGVGQKGSGSGSRKSSPEGRGKADGTRVPPRASSLHWRNLARSASVRREQFEKEEYSKSMTGQEPKRTLDVLQAQCEQERRSPQPGQAWWSQLHGWPCCSRV